MTTILFSEEDLKNPNATGKVVNINRDAIKELDLLSQQRIKAMPKLPVDYICHPILANSEIMMIWAASGLGKSTFALGLANAIANGGDFLKYTCPKPRRVLYVDAEMTINQIKSRLEITEARYPVAEDNLLILSKNHVYPFELPEIQTLEGQAFYLEICVRNKIDVIIFDNLSMLSSFNENMAQEWNPIQRFLNNLRAQGIASVVIHHAGKDGQTYRGTSKIEALMDTVIGLTEVRKDRMDDDYTSEKIYKVFYGKARGFNGEDSRPYEVTLSDKGFSYQSIEVTLLEQVVELMNIPLRQNQIAVELKVTCAYVCKLVKKARMLKLLPPKL